MAFRFDVVLYSLIPLLVFWVSWRTCSHFLSLLLTFVVGFFTLYIKNFIVNKTIEVKLGNGLKIQTGSLGEREAHFIHDEIWLDRCYEKHGITYHENDTIVDVGANIGLFSIFAAQRAPKARILAFEPVPPIHQFAKHNLRAHAPNVKLFDYGLTDRAQTLPIKFYPTLPGNSTVVPESKEAQFTLTLTRIDQLIANARARSKFLYFLFLLIYPVRLIVVNFFSRRLLDSARTYQAKFSTLSNVIREQGIDHIDLLKVDTEGSEYMVLQGIEDKDWARIRKIVLEVEAHSDEILALLRAKGFQFVVEHEPMMAGSSTINVFATRTATPPMSPIPVVGQLDNIPSSGPNDVDAAHQD